jgi:hypothetical protein
MPIFIVIAAAAAAARYLNSQKKLENEEAHPLDPSLLEGLTCIDLLSSEERFIGEQPIRYISFYEGNPSEAAQILWDRLNDIVEKNPWLCGCLVKGGSREVDADVENTPIRIFYDESSSAHPGMFQSYPRGLVRLSRTTPYAELESVLGEFNTSVKANHELLNNMQEALFRVSIIPEHSSCTGSDGFALVVSMSNVFGDDYTFFRLYNMLIGSDDIVSLNPLRVAEFDEGMRNLMGRYETEYVAHITSDPSWEKLFIADNLETPSADVRGKLFEVSTKWINEIKSSKLEHERETSNQHLFYSSFKSPLDNLILKDRKGVVVKRVTTEDIITSWFWNLVKPAVGLLEVNLRERVAVAKTNNAGNYTNSIAYLEDDYKTAERIQMSLSTFCRISKSADPPTILPRVRINTRLSIVSNHLPFCRSKSIVNEADAQMYLLNDIRFKLIRHIPLYFASALSALPKRMSFLDIFEINHDRVGCFVVAPADVLSKIHVCGIVENTISSF